MATAPIDGIVSTDWLAKELGAPDLRVVDASWYLPQQKRDAKAEYAAHHIPGAIYFDIDLISDSSIPLPHMLPSPEQFARQMGELGIGDGDRVVCYDGAGLFSAARAWWMLRAMGHANIAVLDGGFPKWLAEKRPVEAGRAQSQPRRFSPRPDKRLIRSIEQVRNNLNTHREQVLDARARGRFKGTEPEPRPGVRSGHIPGAANLPYNELLDPKTGTVLPKDQLIARFEAEGIDLSKPVVTSCGSGVTASALALGLYLVGRADAAVYDGSWSEWGARTDTPVET
ncbi:MAG: 3-mercaptopyruvate sulfurtransferase [Alphaproteobacteria bacterium]